MRLTREVGDALDGRDRAQQPRQRESWARRRTRRRQRHYAASLARIATTTTSGRSPSWSRTSASWLGSAATVSSRSSSSAPRTRSGTRSARRAHPGSRRSSSASSHRRAGRSAVSQRRRLAREDRRWRWRRPSTLPARRLRRTCANLDHGCQAATSIAESYRPSRAALLSRARSSNASWALRALAARPFQACNTGSCNARP